MVYGISEPQHASGLPPGTAKLEEPHGEHGADAVLVPQPSESPKDPLNMPRIRKELYFLTLIYGACVTGVVGPVLVPGFSIVAVAFDIGLTDVTLLNGSLVMALGVSAYVCAPFSDLFGRRLVYLTTSLLMMAGCVWAGYANTYHSLLGSRIFQGLGMGAFFSLAGTASINDVFFVHQRGRRAGLWNFAVIVCVNIAPVISGYIITGLSWQWSFRVLAIAFGLAFILSFLFLPETLFKRNVMIENIDGQAPTSPQVLEAGEDNYKPPTVASAVNIASASIKTLEATPSSQKSPSLWSEVLGLQDLEIMPLTRLLPMLFTPFALLRHPAVIWGCAMWSVTFSWTIIQGAVAVQIFEAPPFNLSPVAVGQLIGIPPLIGSALGTVLGGWLCDFAAKIMAVRNGGIYEPEFRLTVMVPSIITTGIGAYGLGIAIERGLNIYASAVFLGFLNFGVGVGCTGIVSYTNDVCRNQVAEAFGIAMLIKSAYAFGLTFMLNDYYMNHGAVVFFTTWAALTTGVTLTTIPMYIFGKLARSQFRI